MFEIKTILLGSACDSQSETWGRSKMDSIMKCYSEISRTSLWSIFPWQTHYILWKLLVISARFMFSFFSFFLLFYLCPMDCFRNDPTCSRPWEAWGGFWGRHSAGGGVVSPCQSPGHLRWHQLSLHLCDCAGVSSGNVLPNNGLRLNRINVQRMTEYVFT